MPRTTAAVATALAALFAIADGPAAQSGGRAVRDAVDHVILGVTDLDQGIAWVERLTGVRAAIGGSHPGRGTRNALMSFGGRQYMEILAPDPDQDASVQRQDLIALKEPRVIGWAAAAADLDALSDTARKAGRELPPPRPGSRVRPDGRTVSWRTLNPASQLAADGVDPIPFFIQWASGSAHPSQDAPPGCTLEAFAIEHPAASEVDAFLKPFGIVANAAPAQAAKLIALLKCPQGRVRLE
jgi:hypothetical protein